MIFNTTLLVMACLTFRCSPTKVIGPISRFIYTMNLSRLHLVVNWPVFIIFYLLFYY